MMLTRWRCACGKRLKVPAEHVGRAARCPRCGTVSAVPVNEVLAEIGIIQEGNVDLPVRPIDESLYYRALAAAEADDARASAQQPLPMLDPPRLPEAPEPIEVDPPGFQHVSVSRRPEPRQIGSLMNTDCDELDVIYDPTALRPGLAM